MRRTFPVAIQTIYDGITWTGNESIKVSHSFWNKYYEFLCSHQFVLFQYIYNPELVTYHDRIVQLAVFNNVGVLEEQMKLILEKIRSSWTWFLHVGHFDWGCIQTLSKIKNNYILWKDFLCIIFFSLNFRYNACETLFDITLKKGRAEFDIEHPSQAIWIRIKLILCHRSKFQ